MKVKLGVAAYHRLTEEKGGGAAPSRRRLSGRASDKELGSARSEFLSLGLPGLGI